ncbi:hypothetical protein [Haladaptatus sp. R4]|uniref:hypothetical protein n=1 Tax=Haladaptatus sp. R4 TaxID=1679489 RepID=UPI0016815118
MTGRDGDVLDSKTTRRFVVRGRRRNRTGKNGEREQARHGDDCDGDRQYSFSAHVRFV